MRCSRSHLAAVAGGPLIAVATWLWASQAAAFCQEGTKQAPAGYDPTAQGCITVGAGATGGPPLFWRNECVSYSLQHNASSQISLADAKRVAASSFTAWTSTQCPSGAPPSISVSQYPDVDCDSVPSQQHNNVIMFRDDSWPHDDSANAIGYTTLTADLVTGEILGADIEINTFANTIVADPPAPMGAHDLASILTHEAGHFLGLAHSADTTAVMYAFYQPGSTTLQGDDVGGICAIYDSSGTRNPSTSPVPSTKCNPAPPMGFSLECAATDDAGADDAGDAGDDATDPPPQCTNTSCSMSPATSSRPGSVALFGLVAIGVVARRRHRRRPGTRAARGAVAGAMLAASAIAGARDANASVANAVLFEELVKGASAAAVALPIEQQTVWEDRRIVTYTHLRIDRRVAGELPADVWVGTHGGVVGHIVQIVEGEPSFVVGQPSLLFLRPHVDPDTRAPTGTFVVVERAQGQFPIDAGGGSHPRLTVAPDMGALVPPSPDHWAHASEGLPAGSKPRFARDVLQGRALDEAAREIAAAWRQAHG